MCAGYPLEVHEVVTPDGYLLRMERIPQPSSQDAVFMMHGEQQSTTGRVLRLSSRVRQAQKPDAAAAASEVLDVASGTHPSGYLHMQVVSQAYLTTACLLLLRLLC